MKLNKINLTDNNKRKNEQNMIKSLTIQNFRSHAKSTFEFHSGVNVIIGPSDSGKTAIIRAVRKVVWNRPSGSDICSTWGGETTISLGTEQGIITWSKDKMDKYILSLIGQEPIVFTAFGTSVPEEISRFLNIEEVNLQMQLDSPYLLTKSSGEVASYFNKVAKLDKIDISTQNINSWIRTLTQDIKQNEEQEKLLTEELTQYEYLEKAEMELEVLEGDNKRLIQFNNARGRLIKLLQAIKELEEEIAEVSDIFKHEPLVLELIACIDKSIELGRQETKLENLLKIIKEIDKELKQNHMLTVLEEGVNTILADINSVKELEYNQERLQKALNNINITTIALEAAKADFKAFSTEFKVSFPNICPLCGQEVNNATNKNK